MHVPAPVRNISWRGLFIPHRDHSQDFVRTVRHGFRIYHSFKTEQQCPDHNNQTQPSTETQKMTERLICPKCKHDCFEQERSLIYAETCTIQFDLNGEVEEEIIESSEFSGEDFVGPFVCKACGWELVDDDGDPITDPDEIAVKLNQAPKVKYASTDIREAFQSWLECDADTLELDDEEVGLNWFVERLTGCTDILPAGYCSDLDLPQGSTYGDAMAHLVREARN